MMFQKWFENYYSKFTAALIDGTLAGNGKRLYETIKEEPTFQDNSMLKPPPIQSQESLQELAKLIANAFRATNMGQQGDLMIYVAEELTKHYDHGKYIAVMLENIGRAHGTSQEFSRARDSAMRPDED
jgi:hypothetical protein